jgi:hypothetical protein
MFKCAHLHEDFFFCMEVLWDLSCVKSLLSFAVPVAFLEQVRALCWTTAFLHKFSVYTDQTHCQGAPLLELIILCN